MTLLLCDGTNIVMRCSAVVPEPFECVRVALGMVRKAAVAVGASHLIVAFDSEQSIRKDLYAAYKGDRTTKTGPWVVAATEAFTAANLCCVQSPGYEADDVIAAIVSRVQGREPIAIFSSDSDLLALASDTVTIWRPKKGGGLEAFTPADVCAKYSIPTPQHLTLYKALVGEPGDNVPGVPQIGPKRAIAMIRQHGDLIEIGKAGAVGEHFPWLEKAHTLLSLYTFAVVPQIARSSCALVAG